MQIFGNTHMTYYIRLTTSGHWHIRIQCRNWQHIINVIVPYLNQIYGEKYTAMLKLLHINSLLSVNTVSAKVEIVMLAYSITSSGFRFIPILDKIKAVIGHRSVKMSNDCN